MARVRHGTRLLFIMAVRPTRYNVTSPSVSPRDREPDNVDIPAPNTSSPVDMAFTKFGVSESDSWFFDSILGQFLFPGIQQEKEFAQQVAFQREQNEWNSEQARMERAKEAGINPVTAGQQIVGGSSPSVGSPNSTGSPGTFSELPNALAGQVSTITDAISKAIHNRKELAETAEIAPTAEVTRTLMRAQTYQTFAQARFNTAEAIGIEIENLTRGESLQLDLAAKRLQLPYIRSMIRMHNADTRLKIADAKLAMQKIEESKATMSLMEYQKAVAEAEAMKKAYEAEDIAWNLEFKQKNGYDPQWPSHSIMWSVAADENYTDEEAAAKFDFMLEKLYELKLKEASASGIIQMIVNSNKALDEYYKESALQGEKTEHDIYKSWKERPSLGIKMPTPK